MSFPRPYAMTTYDELRARALTLAQAQDITLTDAHLEAYIDYLERRVDLDEMKDLIDDHGWNDKQAWQGFRDWYPKGMDSATTIGALTRELQRRATEPGPRPERPEGGEGIPSVPSGRPQTPSLPEPEIPGGGRGRGEGESIGETIGHAVTDVIDAGADLIGAGLRTVGKLFGRFFR